MKTEEEQLEFSRRQKEIAQIHSDLVSNIGTPTTDEHVQLIKTSESVMIKNMQDLVYAYIGSNFHQIMKEKE